MMDIWLIFNLLVPFVEICLHTYMDILRTEEEREINHHGRPVKVSGDDDDETTDQHNQVSPMPPVSVNEAGLGGSIKLISTNEKIQQKALQDHYERIAMKRKLKCEKKLALCKKFAIYYNPIIALTFIGLYWGIGLRH